MTISPEISRIEGDLARTRERLAGRLDEFERHLVPRTLLNDALAHFRGGSGGDFTDELVVRVKANPLPAGIAGIAVAWLMTAKGTASGDKRSRPTIAFRPRPASFDTAKAVQDFDRQATPTSVAGDVFPSSTGTQSMARPTRSTIATLTRNPLALGAAAGLVGLIAGALIPTLRREEEALGSVATKLRVAGRDLAQEVVDRGGHVVEDTLNAVKGSADAHGLNAAKPVGEMVADAKSGALAQDIKHVAQEAVQAGRDSAQAHLSGRTD